MAFPLKLAFTLLLLAFPVLETALLIKAGAAFGFWPVLLVIMGTAAIGISVIRSRGVSVFSKVFAELETGGSGFPAMADAFLAVLAGMLLIFPGLICDLLGALLLFAPLRRLLISGGLTNTTSEGWSRADNRADKQFSRRGAERPSGSQAKTRADAPVIEVDYELVEDEDHDQRR